MAGKVSSLIVEILISNSVKLTTDRSDPPFHYDLKTMYSFIAKSCHQLVRIKKFIHSVIFNEGIQQNNINQY